MKRVISTILALMLCLGMSATAFADNSSQQFSTRKAFSIVSPLAEQTEWKYRRHNGRLEKRLWSNTYNKWLTDWIVDPVE